MKRLTRKLVTILFSGLCLTACGDDIININITDSAETGNDGDGNSSMDTSDGDGLVPVFEQNIDILCVQNENCFAEVSQGIYSRVIPECELFDFLNQGFFLIDQKETGCFAGEQIQPFFKEKIYCFKPTEGIPPIDWCYAELVEGWFSVVTPECDLPVDIQKGQLWGGFVPECSLLDNDPILSNTYTEVFCDGVTCFLGLQNSFYTRVSPTCRGENNILVNPGFWCQ